jgi:hypothetical protein
VESYFKHSDPALPGETRENNDKPQSGYEIRNCHSSKCQDHKSSGCDVRLPNVHHVTSQKTVLSVRIVGNPDHICPV